MHYLFKVILLKSNKIFYVFSSFLHCSRECVCSIHRRIVSVLHIVISGVELTLLQGFRYFVEGIIDFSSRPPVACL